MSRIFELHQAVRLETGEPVRIVEVTMTGVYRVEAESGTTAWVPEANLREIGRDWRHEVAA